MVTQTAHVFRTIIVVYCLFCQLWVCPVVAYQSSKKPSSPSTRFGRADRFSDVKRPIVKSATPGPGSYVIWKNNLLTKGLLARFIKYAPDNWFPLQLFSVRYSVAGNGISLKTAVLWSNAQHQTLSVTDNTTHSLPQHIWLKFREDAPHCSSNGNNDASPNRTRILVQQCCGSPSRYDSILLKSPKKLHLNWASSRELGLILKSARHLRDRTLLLSMYEEHATDSDTLWSKINDLGFPSSLKHSTILYGLWIKNLYERVLCMSAPMHCMISWPMIPKLINNTC